MAASVSLKQPKLGFVILHAAKPSPPLTFLSCLFFYLSLSFSFQDSFLLSICCGDERRLWSLSAGGLEDPFDFGSRKGMIPRKRLDSCYPQQKMVSEETGKASDGYGHVRTAGQSSVAVICESETVRSSPLLSITGANKIPQ